MRHNPPPRSPGQEAEPVLQKEKLVAHFKDGVVARGYSRDFRPEASIFHLMSWDGNITTSRKIEVDQLKALFHVKTWGSTERHSDRRKEFPEMPEPRARAGSDAASRTIVHFYDGEEIWGYSQGYRSDRHGFYLVPADPEDNNSKIFVVNSSLVDIRFLDN